MGWIPAISILLFVLQIYVFVWSSYRTIYEKILLHIMWWMNRFETVRSMSYLFSRVVTNMFKWLRWKKNNGVVILLVKVWKFHLLPFSYDWTFQTNWNGDKENYITQKIVSIYNLFRNMPTIIQFKVSFFFATIWGFNRVSQHLWSISNFGYTILHLLLFFDNYSHTSPAFLYTNTSKPFWLSLRLWNEFFPGVLNILN